MVLHSNNELAKSNNKKSILRDKLASSKNYLSKR